MARQTPNPFVLSCVTSEKQYRKKDNHWICNVSEENTGFG